MHAVAQAWEAGKLFHIDLNDQVSGRYDQDFRFGSANPKAAFFLVKFLEDVKYDGSRHFDAHAAGQRTTPASASSRAAVQHVSDSQRECSGMRTRKSRGCSARQDPTTGCRRDALLAQSFDRAVLAAKRLDYERLDQLTMDILLGVR